MRNVMDAADAIDRRACARTYADMATGRGLGIHRSHFQHLYATFVLPCFYPGMELAAFLLFSPLACPEITLRPTLWIFAMLFPLSLLFAPAMFNPHCFELRALLSDFCLWFRRELRDRKNSTINNPEPPKAGREGIIKSLELISSGTCLAAGEREMRNAHYY